MSTAIYKNESYKIVGLCMEVHNQLGAGFLEVVYKDALEYEFNKANIPYSREKEYIVQYKDSLLPHKFYADFVVYDKIILEAKASTSMHDKYIAQTLNYLKVSGLRLAIIANFGETLLSHKRLVL